MGMTITTGMAIPTIMPTAMIETAGLVRLMTWLSPAFPVGGFNYSHGLEQAVASGRVADADGLARWIATLLGRGSAWNDAVLAAASWRAAGNPAELTALAELAEALAGSAERHAETVNLGAAFLAAARAWGEAPVQIHEGAVAWPVAVGGVAGRAGLPLEPVLAALLNAFVTGQTQAAQRLMPLGQAGAVAVHARLEPVIAEVAAAAAAATLDDLGSAALNAEIASMAHETLRSRIFVT